MAMGPAAPEAAVAVGDARATNSMPTDPLAGAVVHEPAAENGEAPARGTVRGNPGYRRR